MQYSRTVTHSVLRTVEYLKKHKRQLLFGAAAAGAVTALYVLFRRRRADAEVASDALTVKINSGSDGGSYSSAQQAMSPRQRKVREIARQVRVKYARAPKHAMRVLDLQTLLDLGDATVALAQEQFNALTQSSRERRRAALAQKGVASPQYQHEALRYNEQVEKLINQCQQELLRALAVTSDVYEESLVTLMEGGLHSEIFMLQTGVKEKLKKGFKPPRAGGSTQNAAGAATNVNVTPNLVKESLRYQAQLLREGCSQIVLDFIRTHQNSYQHLQMLPLLVNVYLGDMVHAKFGIDEEATVDLLPSMFADKEFHALLVDIENEFNTLMTQH